MARSINNMFLREACADQKQLKKINIKIQKALGGRDVAMDTCAIFGSGRGSWTVSHKVDCLICVPTSCIQFQEQG